MTELFWILEYCKVFAAYMFIMFIWPMVVFRKYLRGKSLTFRFGFCVTVQIVIINTLVITLGLLHILYLWIFRIIFYGLFIYSIIGNIKIGAAEKKQIKRILTGTYGIKTFWWNIRKKITDRVREVRRSFSKMMYGRWWEYGLFTIILLFGLIYFCYGSFQDYSYGFGDMYPHNAWIYGLVNGQIFSAGVYPEGMHCFVYGMYALFGIRIYSCMLFLAGIHTLTFLVSAYLMLKEIFHWKYSPMLALTFFLTLDLMCINEVYSMSRLQWTIPQDFGLYTQFLCVGFLLRYLRREGKECWLKKKIFRKILWNDELMVFMLALAASIIIHFYPTIMAFFLCVAFVPLAVGKIFRGGRFSALVLTVICGVMIAVLPMAGALASGIPFQGSIGWAVNIINGTDTEGGPGGAIIVDENTGEEITGDLDLSEIFGGNDGKESSKDSQTDSYENRPENSKPNTSNNGTAIEDLSSNNVVPVSTKDKIVSIVSRIIEKISEKWGIIYREAYVTLYLKERADIILGFSAFAIGIWLCWRVVAILLRVVLHRRVIDRAYLDTYVGLVITTVFFMMLYCEGKLGTPALIAGSRVCAVAQLLVVSMCTIPLDFLFTGMCLLVKEGIMKAVAAFSIFGIYLGTMLTGTFHGYLYYELTRYNGAVMSTYMITEELPQNSFTIVSTVDELYQVVQYGYHEEAIKFLNDAIEDEYTIPTEYVFIYVEKHPIEYAHSHFFGGPKWLAWEKYTKLYNMYVSQCPEINSSEISDELANIPYFGMPESSQMYSKLGTRTIIQSRLYAWCQEFEKLYPNELHTYYEDEDFVCYYFKQNPYSLFNLAIQ